MKIVPALIVLLGLVGCKEFIEPSLENKNVQLFAPADKVEMNTYNQTFWWETIDDALAYRIQIVSPTFDNIKTLVTDTLVKGDKFTLALDPGDYEWRVRPENGSSHGTFTTRAFTIHQASLANQYVIVKSPENGFLTNHKTLNFKWSSLYGASAYHLQVDTNNFSDEENLVFDNSVSILEYSLNIEKEKTYQWRVRAENDMETSKWSTLRIVTLDVTPPEKLMLNTPANGQQLNKPVSLTWNAVPDAKKYELLIYKSDGSTVYNATFPLVLTTTSYSFNLGDFNEKVQWKVRAIDEAGNMGEFSELRNFIIQ